MPFANANSTRLFYRLEGRAGRPVVVLAHSLGCDHEMWAPQLPDFLQHFQVLRYDTRGHGASAVPPGDYALEQLGRDALELTDELRIPKFAWCGLSMGGAIGQWLALHTPERLTALVLANTSAKFGTAETWEARRRAVSQGGMQAVVDAVMQRWFSAEMLAREDPYAESVRRVFLGTDPAGYIACCAALRDVDNGKQLANIHAPALVIGGAEDPSTPWAEHGAILARDIPGAKAVQLPAAHLSNLGMPRSFTTAVLEFLLPSESSPDTLETGLRIRRQVLGADHVERSMAGANEFTRDFQSLLTRYAWGAVWSRPGLDYRTRRMLALVILAAMGRWEEFRLHVRAALQHGLEPCDLKEALLQSAIYAGMPAANTAFQIAHEEMKMLPGGS